MAKKHVKLINLDSAIAEVLAKYGEEVYDVLGDSVDEVADEAVTKLQGVTTYATGGHTEYPSSWVKEYEVSARIHKTVRIHNEEHYRLTHLLENGHVIKNGTGRTFGRTGSYPHIAPVDDWVQEELPRRVEGKLK